MDLLEQLEHDSNLQYAEGMFESIDAAQLAFEDGLNESMLLADDKAYAIIQNSMDYMRSSGEFERLQQMAMVLGAAACNHAHLQELSNQTTERFGDALFGGKAASEDTYNHGSLDSHDHDNDEDVHDDKKKKKKKKKDTRISSWWK